MKSKSLKIFVIFLLLLAALTKTEASGWNISSRMATIQSLVEYHSLAIDYSIFADETGDKYFYNNHFYSDKPPVLALYGSLFYFVLNKGFNLFLTPGISLAYYLITLLAVGVLSALGLVYFRKILVEIFRIDEEWSDVIVLAAGTGTSLLTYSILFNNHTVSGALLIIGFYYLLKMEAGVKNLALSGFFISLSGSIDITCFLFIPFAFIVFIGKSLKSLIIFLLSCLPAIISYLALNWYASGSLIPPAMNKALWYYPGSAFVNGQENLSGLVSHKSLSDLLIYAFHMILGNRGILTHTPLLLFSIWGFIKIFSSPIFPYKKEYIYLIISCSLYILSYIFRTDNYSGSAYGIRWFATLMLLLCLPLAHISDSLRNSTMLKFLFITIASASITMSLVGTYKPFLNFQKPGSHYTFLVSLSQIGSNYSILSKLVLFISTSIIFFCFYKLFQKFQLKSLGE